MARVIAVHSFRGGTGKSNITANMAALLAAEGRRVGVVDTDLQTPGIHTLFGLGTSRMTRSLNDYLWGKCHIRQTAHDVTPPLYGDCTGRLFLVPASLKLGEIAWVLREGYDISLLHEGFPRLAKELELDVLLLDTHPGLNEETLFSITMSDVLAVILRPDQQDYQATSVTVDVARNLAVSRLLLVVNKTPPACDFAEVKTRVERTYNCEVAAVLPHSDEMLGLASNGLFALRFPDHQVTTTLKQVAHTLMA